MTNITTFNITTNIMGQNTTTQSIMSTEDNPIPETYKDHYTYFGETVNYLFGTIDLVLALICILLNAIIIIYYRKSFRKVVPFSFSALAFSDFCSGIGALLHTCFFYLINDHSPNNLQYLIRAAYFVTAFALKISVFVSLMISIVRSVHILNPFKRINYWTVAGSFLFYCILWICLLTTETCLSLQLDTRNLSERHYQDTIPSTFYSTGNTFEFVFQYKDKMLDHNKCLIEYAFSIIPCVLPAQVAVICMILQFNGLRNRFEGRSVPAEKVQEQRNLTLTIFLLTMVFFVCNTAGIIIPSITTCRPGYDTKPFPKSEYIATYLLGIFLPFLNSALNPIIMISRSRKLREFVCTHYRLVKRHSLKATRSFNSFSQGRTQASMVIENVGVSAAAPGKTGTENLFMLKSSSMVKTNDK